MRVAVLGAAGTIAPAIVADLAASAEVAALTLLDLDGAQAAAIADAHGAGRATGAAVDARDRPALAAALAGHDVVVNAASYRVNLAVMDAALDAGCAYFDLGGLYHVTTEQLTRDAAFRDAGILGVLGVGAGPGKTNVMAVRAAAELDEVEAISCASAGLDEDPPDGLSVPYALATLLDEVSVAPVAVRNGAPVELAPLAPAGPIAFPEPIGEREAIHTLHSEVRTLPDSLGARSCDFALAVEPRVLDALLALRGRTPEEIAAVPVARPSARTWSAQHVRVRGRRGGDPAEAVMTAVTERHAAWGLGGGIVSTASVAAASVRLYARGLLPEAGVLPPERALPPEGLFAELEARGCRFSLTVQPPIRSESR